MQWTSLLLQKLRQEVVITCNRVTGLALCTISDGHLSMYQVSFDSLLYFQRYAPDKFNIAKIRRNNSINTEDRVMVLSFCVSAVFFMRNLNMKFQSPSMHSSKLMLCIKKCAM